MSCNSRNSSSSPAWFMTLMLMLSVVLFQGAFIPEGGYHVSPRHPHAFSGYTQDRLLPDAVQAGNDELLLTQGTEIKDTLRREKTSEKKALHQGMRHFRGICATAPVLTLLPASPDTEKGFASVPGWDAPASFPLPPPLLQG